jgi:hypothetical protein
MKWEYYKHRFQIDARKFIKEKNIKYIEERKKVETDTNNAFDKYMNDPLNIEKKENYENHVRKLTIYDEEDIKKLAFRSKCEFFEKGERNTKIFYRKLRQVRASTTMTSLIDENGQEITNKNSMADVVKNYYENLFKKNDNCQRNIELQDKIEGSCWERIKLVIPQIDEQTGGNLEKDIDESEVTKAMMKAIAPFKAPGDDGIPSRAYKVFWNEWKLPLMESFNEAIEKGELSASQKRSIITLIEKKGKDKTKIENWRPISLMNCDTKILAHNIASRLQPNLDKLVTRTETGFIAD